MGNIKSTENLLKKDKSKQVKEIVNVRGTRDMFGRLLYLLVRKEFDLNTLFHYPILPEPPYFTHPDGSLREGKKVSVLYLMKRSINSYILGDVNVVIADRMFIIQTSVKDKTPSFAAFARSVLLRVLKLTKHRVELCFDVYESSSIKDINRESRGDGNTEKHFTFGPRQRIPSDFNELLKISSFKRLSLRFLYKEYEDPVYGPVLGKKLFIVL